MKPECPNFDLQAAQERLLRFGWVSVPIDTPKAVVDEFAKEHGLCVTRFFFHYLLQPNVTPAESTADREAHWEKIRQEQHARKLKLASNRKKGEATK